MNTNWDELIPPDFGPMNVVAVPPDDSMPGDLVDLEHGELLPIHDGMPGPMSTAVQAVRHILEDIERTGHVEKIKALNLIICFEDDTIVGSTFGNAQTIVDMLMQHLERLLKSGEAS